MQTFVCVCACVCVWWYCDQRTLFIHPCCCLPSGGVHTHTHTHTHTRTHTLACCFLLVSNSKWERRGGGKERKWMETTFSWHHVCFQTFISLNSKRPFNRWASHSKCVQMCVCCVCVCVFVSPDCSDDITGTWVRRCSVRFPW